MRKGSRKDKRRDKSHQATRRFQLPGSELSGKAGREVLECSFLSPKGHLTLHGCASSLELVVDGDVLEGHHRRL